MPISAANVTLRQLSAFAAVVDHGGFGAAAVPLNMTQSAVSQAVRSLEQALGGPLLVRDKGRGASQPPELTDLGRSTLSNARDVLFTVGRIVTDAAIAGAQTRETVRVGGISSVALQLLELARGEFERRNPLLTIDLCIGTDSEVRQWLAEGSVDIGLVGPSSVPVCGARMVPLIAAAVPLSPSSGARLLVESLMEYAQRQRSAAESCHS